MNRKQFINNISLLSFGAATHDSLITTRPRAAENAVVPELVINAGIAGNNTNNLLQRIDKDCLSHHPSLVIMMIGTNDMNNGKHVPLPRFRANLETLTIRILGSGSKLLLMTILPIYEPYLLTRHPAAFFQPEGVAGRRKAVNDTIQQVAADKKVAFFDIGKIFEKIGKVGLDADSLIRNEANVGKTDGVHPTRNGYRFMGMAVAQYLLYHDLPLKRIVCFGDSITKGDGSTDKESYPAYLKNMLS